MKLQGRRVEGVDQGHAWQEKTLAGVADLKGGLIVRCIGPNTYLALQQGLASATGAEGHVLIRAARSEAEGTRASDRTRCGTGPAIGNRKHTTGDEGGVGGSGRTRSTRGTGGARGTGRSSWAGGTRGTLRPSGASRPYEVHACDGPGIAGLGPKQRAAGGIDVEVAIGAHTAGGIPGAVKHSLAGDDGLPVSARRTLDTLRTLGASRPGGTCWPLGAH